ncbi:programmed cell death protein 2-like isoform X1 [Hippoglossus stenolepis]|uniref:programmed cell death protein 2-like isoform X1 n=1 Tax=Hippoglossus stenolepis TaxID=195615 RepID=UPI001FAFA5B1|nr:programmed cell death protein 2-like isoform X1 [Hippoglossus stenolepis]
MASAAQDGTLVGVCDAELDPDRHRSTYLTNKVGGQPDWLPGISPLTPRCARCGAPLSHVVQVYCPLEASPYHRSLHLFACPGPACSGGSQGWRVLRSQSLETQVQQRAPGRPAPAQEAPLSATDWCDTADDWGLEEEGWGGGVVKKQVQDVMKEQVQEEQVQEEAAAPEAESPALSSRLQDLSLGESHNDFVVFRSFFISVVQESDLWGEEDELEHAQELLKEYEGREGVTLRKLEGGEGGEEKYEKSRARHGDAFFSRFMKRISLCPQQILRYCRGGRTLFISEPPPNVAQVVSACGSCGGARTFELQLMPALVSLLQRKDGGGAEVDLEFGTVLVFTCVNSCWTAGSGSAVEEFCFVQTDPDQQLFK